MGRRRRINPPQRRIHSSQSTPVADSLFGTEWSQANTQKEDTKNSKANSPPNYTLFWLSNNVGHPKDRTREKMGSRNEPNSIHYIDRKSHLAIQHWPRLLADKNRETLSRNTENRIQRNSYTLSCLPTKTIMINHSRWFEWMLARMNGFSKGEQTDCYTLFSLWIWGPVVFVVVEVCVYAWRVLDDWVPGPLNMFDSVARLDIDRFNIKPYRTMLDNPASNNNNNHATNEPTRIHK